MLQIARTAARSLVTFWRDVTATPAEDLSRGLKEAAAAQRERTKTQIEIRDLKSQISTMAEMITDSRDAEDRDKRDYFERAAELFEARNMCGSGPWLTAEARPLMNLPLHEAEKKLREVNPLLSNGATGDIELALQNVEWRREINLSWLEFSRWGIQNVILISRLYYIKNPLIRRLIDIVACYIFGRGFEVSSPNQTANEVLRDFFEENKVALGQVALTKLHRDKFTDGNIFWVFFPDPINTGKVKVRTIDATEVQDIITDPNDADMPRYYRREWVSRGFDEKTGAMVTRTAVKWYPSIYWNPTVKPPVINDIPVEWDTPIYHRKCGVVGKWHFGLSLIYPALDWAREARRYLEACASVMQALNQIALRVTSKGGQQALFGIKQQMQSTVMVGNSIWDENPPGVAGSTFASGPGMKFEAMKTAGAAQDPERVRQYKLMCCMVVGVPETYAADVSTGNLATAQTLDRPTEMTFMNGQEEWSEDFVEIGKYVLNVSKRAQSGKLRDALRKAGLDADAVNIREVAKERNKEGRMVYVSEAKRGRSGSVEIMATFPSIREGDIPELVKAIVQALTLGNTQGVVTGIDAKRGIRMLFEQLGAEDAEELVEEMYPDGEYDMDRTKEPPPPVPGADPDAPPTPQPKPKARATKSPSPNVKEALQRLLGVIEKLQEAHESAKTNGNSLN